MAWVIRMALACALCTVAPATVADVQFDEELAERLGADDYGMRPYVMAFLRAGSADGLDTKTLKELQAGHMALIQRLAQDGKLVLAGPFLDSGELRGIYVLAVETVEEARALTAGDPAIAADALSVDFKPWYGSAALGELQTIHAAIAREVP
jgi:uncharacterized protein YciI